MGNFSWFLRIKSLLISDADSNLVLKSQQNAIPPKVVSNFCMPKKILYMGNFLSAKISNCQWFGSYAETPAYFICYLLSSAEPFFPYFLQLWFNCLSYIILQYVFSERRIHDCCPELNQESWLRQVKEMQLHCERGLQFVMIPRMDIAPLEKDIRYRFLLCICILPFF